MSAPPKQRSSGWCTTSCSCSHRRRVGLAVEIAMRLHRLNERFDPRRRIARIGDHQRGVALAMLQGDARLVEQRGGRAQYEDRLAMPVMVLDELRRVPVARERLHTGFAIGQHKGIEEK